LFLSIETPFTFSFVTCLLVAIYFKLHLLLIIIHITCLSLSLRRTSAPIYLTSILGVLGTQETFCIIIAGLFERDSFDLLLPEFDKPWVIHLRETCCCSTNLCTWRPNTVYKNRRARRHQAAVAICGHKVGRAALDAMVGASFFVLCVRIFCSSSAASRSPAKPSGFVPGLDWGGAVLSLQADTSPTYL
jgi:hypothetical protein